MYHFAPAARMPTIFTQPDEFCAVMFSPQESGLLRQGVGDIYTNLRGITPLLNCYRLECAK
jgi:hypothetical protein